MRLFGLVGYPLTHSFSKTYFTQKFSSMGMGEELVYENFSIPDIEEFTKNEKLIFEKELLGFFLTDHPLNNALSSLFAFNTHKLSDLGEEKNGTKVRVCGLIVTVKKIFTKKNNDEMAFVTIEDNVGSSIECVVFPKTFQRAKQYLVKDSILIIEGKLDFKEEQPVIIVEGLRTPN